MSDEFVLDLDADRERRAAEREAKNVGLTIRLGGKQIAVLPPEFPLDALEPLRRVDQDIAMLLRQLYQMSEKESDSVAAAALVVDLLAYNPNLPSMFLDVMRECGNRLIGEDGVQALIDYRPTSGDLAALVKGVSEYYGLRLGESPESSELPEISGETSSATSNDSTESTPAASTRSRKRKAS